MAADEKKITLKELLAGEKGEELIGKVSFECGLELLDELVKKVEAGAVPLDTAVRSYERGVLLIERLRSLLAGAEEKIRIIQGPGGTSGGEG